MGSRRVICAVWGLVALASGLSSSARAGAASARFEADCRALTAGPHRLAGTPEAKAAADHVLRRLEDIGVDSVIEQPFQTVQTRAKRCRMVVPGRPQPLALLPLRPNGIIPPVTPEGGVTGELIYAGSGEPHEFTTSPLGKIVALDYNSGRGWLRAFARGAKAVVFVSKGPDEAWQTLHSEAHANLLRFYYPGRREDLPEGRTVTIHSEVVWEGVTGRNIYAFLKGTDALVQLEKEEVIIVAVDLDSFGEVPRASAGARKAANCAGLLAMIEHMKANRPRRHMLFAFLDAEARGHAGASAFYRVLEDKTGQAVHLKKRRGYLDNEKKFLAALKDQLGQDKPWLASTDVDSKFVLRLKNKAESHVDDYNDALEYLRKERKLIDRDLNLLEKRIRPRIDELDAMLAVTTGDDAAALREERDRLREAVGAVEERKPRLKVVEAEMARLQTAKAPWNNVRRGLVHGNKDGTMVEDAEKNRLAMENLTRALKELGEDIEIRREELQFEERALDADQAISDLIAKHWISLHVSLAFGDTSPRWGLIIGGDSGLHSNADDHGHYGKIQRTFLTAYEGVAKDGSVEHFIAASADGSLTPPRVLWGAPFFVHSGEVSGRYGIYNLVLGTCQESLPREGTPSDTLEALDTGCIERQAAEATLVLARAADEKGLSLLRAFSVNKHYYVPEFSTSNNITGPLVMARSRGGSVPNKPMPNTIVYFAPSPKGWPEFRPRKAYAFDNCALARTNQNGSYCFGPVPLLPGWHKRPGFAADFDERGMVRHASDLQSSRPDKIIKRQNVFRALHGAVVLPPQMDTKEAQVLGGRTEFGLPEEKAFQETFDGIIYWYCEERAAGIKLFGANSAIALFEEEEREGGTGLQGGAGSVLARGRVYGLDIEAQWDPIDIVEQSAGDIWRLNNRRLKLLRTRGVMNKSLQELHARAEDLLSAANGEGEGKTVSEDEKSALLASALLMEAPVYTQTRSALDDLVHAVLVLLALSVPFAFALERLLVGATNIYRQISW
ncbi:MAG: M28 family peptidase, partial [Planctomycetota bacterium]